MNQLFNNIIKEISKSLDYQIKQVNKIILEKIQSDTDLIPKIASHIISSGGKRIRPLLILLSANLFNYKGQKDILIAACVELIHSATLLHDDVVDENKIRRGVATSNSIWDNKSSILVGDYLFSKAFELMVETDSLEILKTLSLASSILAKGEIMQLTYSNDIEINEKLYFEIITAKTASLFEASSKVGAMLTNTSKDNINNIALYGRNIGIIFQIIDDILDYTSNQETLKKGIGTDFKEGKITLPIILLLKQSNLEEKDFIKRTFVELEQKEGDFENLLRTLQKYNIFQESFDIAKKYAIYSKTLLDNINIENNLYKEYLYNLASFSVKRKY